MKVIAIFAVEGGVCAALPDECAAADSAAMTPAIAAPHDAQTAAEAAHDAPHEEQQTLMACCF